MTPSNRIAIVLVTVAAAFSAPVFAQDQSAPAPAPAPAEAAPAPDATPAPAPTPKKPVINHALYKTCLSQKMAVADTYCAANATGCDAEKAGAKTECTGEAKGVKQTG